MKTPRSTKAEQSAPSKRKFTGTDNPRHLPVVIELTRERVDSRLMAQYLAQIGGGHV